MEVIMREKNNLNDIKIIECIGNKLTPDIIDYMVKHRIKEYGENKKDFENNEKDSIFFFLKNDIVIKAFWMLKPVTLYCDSEQYQVMGIGNIMAVEKGKGYGTVLMNYIKNYLEQNDYIGIGSTHGNNFNFYEICGFTFIPTLIEKVAYIDKNTNTKEHRRDSEKWDHQMFVFDKNNKLQELIKKNKDIVVKVPFW